MQVQVPLSQSQSDRPQDLLRAGDGSLRTVAVLLALTVLTACRGLSPTATHPPALHVSTSGDDSHDGTARRPLRSLHKALQEATGRAARGLGGIADGTPTLVRLAPGVYQGPELVVSTPLTILGNGAAISAHLVASGAPVRVSGALLREGAAARAAGMLTLEETAVEAGSRPTALDLDGASASLRDVVLTCGARACAEARSATVSATRLRLVANAQTQRGIVAHASRFDVEQLEIAGTRIAQVLVDEGSKLRLVGGTLADAGGNGIVVVRGSAARVENARVLAVNDIAALADGGSLVISGGTLASRLGPTVGVSGGTAHLDHTILHGGRGGALSLDQQDGVGSADLVAGEVHHGRHVGVSVASGALRIEGTRFIGAPDASEDGGEGVLASGIETRVHVRAHFEDPASFAISLTNELSATISATVARPRLGGVFVGSAASEEVKIRGLVVEDCRLGSGVVAMDSSRVVVERSRIVRCAEAGILAGTESDILVQATELRDNEKFGLAAFGGSHIRAEAVRVTGSRWATFATCSDAATIVDLQGNLFAGPTVDCP